MTTTPSALFQKWMRSREEEKKSGEQIYRPDDFNFPPARGRSGFEIKADGDFIYIGIAPENGRLIMAGHWNQSRENFLNVELESGVKLTFKYLKLNATC